MQTRKETAWKKSRKFGDVHGGRTRKKIPDNIVARMHSLTRPSHNEELPIVIEDNPSRDFIFPVSGQELSEVFQAFPERIKKGLTHIWLRKAKKSDYYEGELPLGCFICGSGVRVIIMYPFPYDLCMRFGKRKPSGSGINKLLKYCGRLIEKEGEWVLQWKLDELRRYYVEYLFTHELGHHIDWYSREWSKANVKEIEDFADDFAVVWSQRTSKVFNQINRRSVSQAESIIPPLSS